MDLLLSLRRKLIAIEVKLGAAAPETSSLEACMRHLGLKRGYVVSLTRSRQRLSPGVTMCGLPELLEELGLRPRR